ncbi:MAG TPA: response regulator [Kofleriaceae bacterium]
MSAAPAETAKRKLLVIDDSELILAAEEAVLTAAGFEVRTVSSLRQFVNALIDWQPHMIVTDLYMPEMQGDALCNWVRQQVATSSIPIVIYSSAPDEELAEVAKNVRADAYVSKNAGIDVLPARLHQLCDEILW